MSLPSAPDITTPLASLPRPTAENPADWPPYQGGSTLPKTWDAFAIDVAFVARVAGEHFASLGLDTLPALELYRSAGMDAATVQTKLDGFVEAWNDHIGAVVEIP